MKKYLIAVLSLFVLLSITACGTLTTVSTTETGSTTTTTTLPGSTTTTFKTDTATVNYDGSYCDTLAVDYDFIDDLLSGMTTAEKVGQMLQAEKNGANAAEAATYNLGSVLSGGGSAPASNTPYEWYLMYKNYQNSMRTSSSSGIPIIYGVDAVHGHNNVMNATIFPHNIGLGAANDPELMTKIGLITAREVRVTGINYTFAPTIAVVQNIGWGRTYESLSENADLVSNLSEAYIDGLQNYCIGATAKHFVADGGTDDGHDQGNALLTDAEIRAIHLKPYVSAIEAGVYSVMVSYSSINGEKMHGSTKWITDVLKTELGFDGFVISDYDAIKQLPGSYYDQIVDAINAGVDMLMEPFTWKDCINNIILAINNGDISITRINDAVRRILIIKYKMGLFADDFYNETTQEYYRLSYEEGFATAENKAVAREAVRKSLVLLKNENQTLPLKKSDTVAVIGNGASNIGLQTGGWTISWQGSDDEKLTRGTTIIGGIRQAVATGSGAVKTDIDDADIVIVVLSERPYAEYNGDTLNPSLTGSTADSGNQAALDQAMLAKSSGKTVIGLLLSGRPMIINSHLQYFDAFVACFLPGSEGGLGIADVLFGDYDFTGKLPVTWPKFASALGMNSNSATYDAAMIQFPFGYGLSYKED